MLSSGEVFAGYVVERQVGQGGMAEVYLARHPRLPKRTALKLLRRELLFDKEVRERFHREADLVALLEHPNIVTVYDRGIEQGRLWMSMQYVDGVDAASVDLREGSPERAIEIIAQAAEALDYAHRNGVVHRDVKPANLLLVPTEPGERVYLADFGIARLRNGEGLTQTGTFTATMAFASPEQLGAGDPVEGASDQYSLACTLFRLLTGTTPFTADNAATMIYHHLHTAPPKASRVRTDLPPALDAVLARALAKQPQERFHSCGEFAAAARKALAIKETLPERPASSNAPAYPPAWFLQSDGEGIPSVRYPVAHGCLLGGAIGDALGAPVEHLALHRIRERYGPAGVTGDRARFGGSISEETQLTLFTAEAMLRSRIRARARGIGGATVGITQMAYLEWLRGQDETIPEQSFALKRGLVATHPALMERRGVAKSVISALRSAAERDKPGHPLGTISEPINDSKGCAAVVRSAPCGFLDNAQTAFGLGCDVAALTHGHPSGWLPAGTLAALISGLWSGHDLPTALDHAMIELGRQHHHEETTAALTAAMRLSLHGLPEPEDLESLGGGWTGPDALAIAVCAALAAESTGGSAPEIVRRGLLSAVNHSGDSDSTGALCGNILGARYGVQAIPEEWASRSEVGDLVYRLATDYCIETGPRPPSNDYGEPSSSWYARYPG